MRINKKIEILDSTLREGEQTPGVSFTRSQKIEIAKMLEIDNLVYQSVDNLRKSIINNSAVEDLEMSCFTGSYITGNVNQEYLKWVETEYKF